METLDPVSRFKELVSAVRPAPALESDQLEVVIAAAADNPAEPLAEHIALNSPLTKDTAQKLVADALPATGTPAEKAKAVSKAAAAVPSISGEVDLSDPVMLWPWLRGVFGGVLTLTALLVIWLVYMLNKAPTESYVVLAVLGVLSLVGILVLVMGYKTVTIKGSTKPS